MKVEKLMEKEVGACEPNDAGAVAAKMMWERDCGAVPVVNEQAQVLGMITDRDLCIASYLEGKPIHEIPVSRVMSRELWTCHPGDDVTAAENTMREHQVRRLPVVDEEGKLRGVLSLCDIAREAEREAKSGTKKTEVSYTDVARTLADIDVPRSSRGAAKGAQAS
jgi:CBS domain-containing protein